MDHIEQLDSQGVDFFQGRLPNRNNNVLPVGNAWLLANEFIRKDLMTVMRLKHLEERGFIPSPPKEKAKTVYQTFAERENSN